MLLRNLQLIRERLAKAQAKRDNIKEWDLDAAELEKEIQMLEAEGVPSVCCNILNPVGTIRAKSRFI